MSATQSIERELVRDKASRMDNYQLATEITRCRHGMAVGANAAARSRFERRLHIMQAELESRRTSGGAR